jgi:regulatory protein
MNYLARREHSHDELFRKLKQKKFAETEIYLVLDKLTQEGLLSHTRFIENYIHFRLEKGFGPLRIQAELIKRGLSQEFIEQHLKISDNLWIAVVRKLWQKRFKGIVAQDFKERGRQVRFLQYRGFTQEQIEEVLGSCHSREDVNPSTHG